MLLDCMIIGDSIAVGTHMARPECSAYAKGGINSWQFNKLYTQNFDADTVVISLGSNDHKYVHTKDELLKVRKRVKAKKVYWILPAIKPEVQYTVEEVANQYRDWVVIIPALSSDGVHPTYKGYKKIGEITK